LTAWDMCAIQAALEYAIKDGRVHRESGERLQAKLAQAISLTMSIPAPVPDPKPAWGSQEWAETRSDDGPSYDQPGDDYDAGN